MSKHPEGSVVVIHDSREKLKCAFYVKRHCNRASSLFNETVNNAIPRGNFKLHVHVQETVYHSITSECM